MRLCLLTVLVRTPEIARVVRWGEARRLVLGVQIGWSVAGGRCRVVGVCGGHRWGGGSSEGGVGGRVATSTRGGTAAGDDS